MFASIRTTVIGFALIILGVVGMAYYSLDKIVGGSIVTAGLGLLVAKDGNVTGGTKEQ